MEFPVGHIERHQQIRILQDDLSVRYSELKMRYEILHGEMIDYKTRAHYWEAQFTKFKSREETLKTEIEELKAKLRKREQQLFGRKSEKNTNSANQSISPQSQSFNPKNKKGQQAGKPGHGKRDFSYLPTVEETVDLLQRDTICPCCKLPYEELKETEDSEILEIIHVKPYRRVICRKKYKRHCQCEKNPDPGIITPPPSERLIPKCKLGISIWAYLLLKKFEFQQPLHRTLAELSSNGLSLAKGSITDGFQKLLPLFIPVYDAIVDYSIRASHWHADETGWKVFETVPGKKNNRWFLWIFQNAETVVFKIDKTRSSQVLMNHFGAKHKGGILNVDRYAAYKVIAKSGLFILAFCWAHVRRDFLNYSKEYPKNEAFGLIWVEKINDLYHINNQRLQHKAGSKAFDLHNQILKKAILAMQIEMKQALEKNDLLPSAKKLLISLNKHWPGLTVFVEHPEIPMDNNTAERGLRTSVVGRKNYYGSGAVWSAELTTALFTLFGTLKLWNINIHTWLLGYFYECALLGGKPPDIQKYLPWNMDEKKKLLFAEPPKHENPELE
jgi:transposase